MGAIKSSDIVQAVSACLSQYIQAGQTVCAALSGGMDSIVLLRILHRLQTIFGYHLTACHVHHGLSPNASQWADFCRNICHSLHIPLEVAYVGPFNTAQIGIEQAARTARYRVLARQSADMIALAHHQDDQAETVLLQLFRGAGLTGLSAMPVWTKQVIDQDTKPQSLTIIRPLLNISRIQLQALAIEQCWEWVEDESNTNTQYRRNWIRHDILPSLQTRYPVIKRILAQTAHRLQDTLRLVDELAEIDAKQIIDPVKHTLDLSAWRCLPPHRNANVLRYWLKRHHVRIPSEIRFQALLNQLQTMCLDHSANCLSFDVSRLGWYRGQLYHIPYPEIISGYQQSYTIVPQFDWLPMCATLESVRGIGQGIGEIHLKNRCVTVETKQRLSETFQPAANRPHKTLKNLFQEAGIPPWARDVWPLIRIDGTLAAIPGIGTAPQFAAELDMPGYHFSIRHNNIIHCY